MNTHKCQCEKLLTGWNQLWLHVTTVRLRLCGQTLSRLAGGNFTPCKQEGESAAQGTPEGCSLRPNQRKHVSLHSFRHTNADVLWVWTGSRVYLLRWNREYMNISDWNWHTTATRPAFFSCQRFNATHATFPLVQLLPLSLVLSPSTSSSVSSARPRRLQRIPSPLLAAMVVLISPAPPGGS